MKLFTFFLKFPAKSLKPDKDVCAKCHQTIPCKKRTGLECGLCVTHVHNGTTSKYTVHAVEKSGIELGAWSKPTEFGLYRLKEAQWIGECLL